MSLRKNTQNLSLRMNAHKLLVIKESISTKMQEGVEKDYSTNMQEGWRRIPLPSQGSDSVAMVGLVQ